MENKNKAIEELEMGRDFANQLRLVINGGGRGGGGAGADGGGHGSSSMITTTASTTKIAEKLVKKVLMSFTNSIKILNNPNGTHHEVYHAPFSCGITKSEDSQESNCKSSTLKERRGCYKRRRTSQSWEKDSETPIDDGHQWRKYGQKVILNAKHPRNYYRCTHKFDQGCQATKQVQRVQDDPPLYKNTYHGHHTCRNLLSPEIILDSPSNSSSVFLSFDNTIPTPTKLQDCPLLSSSSLVKKEEEIPNNNSSNNSSNNDHYLISSSDLTFDHNSNDVISSVLYDSAEFDEAFQPFFDFC